LENDKSLIISASEALLGIEIPTDIKQRTKDDRKKSFQYVWEYVKKEKTLVHYGLMSLVGSLLIDLSVPIYIG
jgi:hypothetical protein